ncbi:sodium:calcium antiporter [Azospirillum sp. sgz301742]
MLLTIVLLLASAALIYAACETFVNGIEWVGRKLGLSQTATGTVLAALGTALPESVVPLVAVAFGDGAAHKDIGVGAALGGPLALSTLAYAVVGMSLLANRRRIGRANTLVQVDGLRLSRDQMWFLGIFIVKIALGAIVFAVKPWLGIAFLATYAVYIWKEVRCEDGDGEEGELEPLRIRPSEADPALGWALAQTGVALLVIFAASQLFVGQIGDLAPALGLPPQVTALLLSPLATELPETMNAIIWVRQGKERLALANISGAMMIQATVPTAFGLFFTPWLLDTPLFLAAGFTAVAVASLMLAFRSGLVSGGKLTQVGWLYLVFAGILAAAR